MDDDYRGAGWFPTHYTNYGSVKAYDWSLKGHPRRQPVYTTPRGPTIRSAPEKVVRPSAIDNQRFARQEERHRQVVTGLERQIRVLNASVESLAKLLREATSDKSTEKLVIVDDPTCGGLEID